MNHPVTLTERRKYSPSRPGNPVFHESGFPARFLFSFPPSRIGRRAVDPAPLDPSTVAAYGARITKVATALRDTTEVMVLTLDPAADAVRLDYARKVEAKLGPNGELAHIRGWAGKVVGATARIAGLLHLLEHGTTVNTITTDSMSGAVALGEYFTAHALHAFDEMAARDDDLELARRVVALIGRHPTFTEFSVRDLFTAAPRSWMPNSKTMRSVLRQLVDLGWLLPIPPDKQQESKPGRTPSPRHRAHPRCHQPAPRNARYPQNPRNPTETGSSADSAYYADPSRRVA
ncbi:MAG: DUF3987 domain-containing protein [Mycobacteriaceae bacterium]